MIARLSPSFATPGKSYLHPLQSIFRIEGLATPQVFVASTISRIPELIPDARLEHLHSVGSGSVIVVCMSLK